VDCDHFDTLIESLVDGEPADEAARAHLAACEACRAALERARAIDRVLEMRETPQVPADFTGHVMARVAVDQWRAELIVDAGFNVALALGGALVLIGGAGLAWAFGWLGLDQPTLHTLGAALRPWIERAAAEAQMVGLAALLLTSALGVWWWVEGEASA